MFACKGISAISATHFPQEGLSLGHLSGISPWFLLSSSLPGRLLPGYYSKIALLLKSSIALCCHLVKIPPLWLDFGAIHSLVPIHISSGGLPSLCWASFAWSLSPPESTPQCGWPVVPVHLGLGIPGMWDFQCSSWRNPGWTRMGWSSPSHTISTYWNSTHFKGSAQFPAGPLSSSTHRPRVHVAPAVYSISCHRCLCSLLSLHRKCK